MTAGVIASSRLSEFQDAVNKHPSVVLTFQEEESKTYILVITMKRDDAQINSILDRFGFLEVEFSEEMKGGREEVSENINVKIRKLEVG